MSLNSTHTYRAEEIFFLAKDTMLHEHYRIDDVVGHGGMGIVYAATDIAGPEPRRCAIKETPTPLDNPPTLEQEICARALRVEYDIMSTVEHKAIPHAYDFFSWEGRQYLVMQFVDGEPMSKKLGPSDKRTKFDEETIVNWTIQICEVFEFLHKQSPPIIYRDCKPDNFIITKQNEVRIIDFGIARRKLDDADMNRFTLLGTRGYAAPETYLGAGDERTDIFSLGVMMHVLLTGIEPHMIAPDGWQRHSPRSLRPSLSSAIDTIILKCLQAKRELRYASIAALRSSLLQLQHAEHNSSGVLPNIRFSRPLDSGILMDPIESGYIADNEAYDVMPKLAWHFETKGPIHSAPTVHGDTLYFGSHDRNFYALSTKGELVRSFGVRDAIYSDPVVTDRAVFFGSADGVIYAVDHQLTRRLWAYGTRRRISSSPTLIDDLIVFGTDTGTVYAMPVEGPEPRWRGETWGGVRGELATIEDHVVFGAYDSHVYAYDAQGKLCWKRQVHDRVDALPVAGDGIIVIGSRNFSVFGLEQASGIRLWRTKLDGAVVTGAAIHGKQVYVGSSEGCINCMDLVTGEVKLRRKVRSQITSDLVVQQQRLYFGCRDGGVYCLDLKHLETIWRYQTRGAIVTRPTFVGNVVIVASLDKSIYAIIDTPLAVEE